MKKIFCVLSATIAAACFIGCASNKFDKEAYNPSAVMSIKVNATVDWYGDTKEDKPSGLLAIAAKKMALSNENENVKKISGSTKDLLPEIERIAEKSFKETDALNFIDFNKVCSLPEYKDASESGMLKATLSYLTPGDFRLLDRRNDATGAVISETGAKSFTYVDYNLQKLMVNGVEKNGTMTAVVTCQVVVLDEKGKVLVSKNGFARSSEKLPVVMSIYDQDKFMSLYPDVIRDATLDALNKIGK